MINYLRQQGINDKIIGIIIIMLASFLIIFGLTILGLYTYDSIHNIEPPPLVGYVLGGIGTVAIGLISSHFTNAAIDGTATRTAASVAQAFSNGTNATLQANTQATQANTQATVQATESDKKVG